jgi:hypothetical protein
VNEILIFSNSVSTVNLDFNYLDLTLCCLPLLVLGFSCCYEYFSSSKNISNTVIEVKSSIESPIAVNPAELPITSAVSLNEEPFFSESFAAVNSAELPTEPVISLNEIFYFPESDVSDDLELDEIYSNTVNRLISMENDFNDALCGEINVNIECCFDTVIS